MVTVETVHDFKLISAVCNIQQQSQQFGLEAQGRTQEVDDGAKAPPPEIALTSSCSQPKMHQISLGSRAPPDPLGELTVLSHNA